MSRLSPFCSELLMAGLLAGASFSVNAHETWLLPETFHPVAGEATTILMTSGMAFPALNTGIDRMRIKEAKLHQDGQEFSLVPAGAIRGALQLSAVTRPGVACAWVALQPRILEIEPDGVAHYLEEVGAGPDIWSTYEAQPQPREWRESYSKLARTYLSSGPALSISPAVATQESGGCWGVASNARFDVLPTSNPGVLEAGDSLTLAVQFDGKPLAEQAVAVIREGDEPMPMQRSDANGQLTFEFPEPGRYMIYATALRPLESSEANWESDFVTLTLDVAKAAP